jgi:hypothetical protein
VPINPVVTAILSLDMVTIAGFRHDPTELRAVHDFMPAHYRALRLLPFDSRWKQGDGPRSALLSLTVAMSLTVGHDS